MLSATASALIVWGMVTWGGLSYSDSARLFQAVGAVTVIFVGGVFAYWRLQIFRTFQPHLTISHEISHRFVGDSYVHIAVTVNLRNSSKVKIGLREAIFSVQLIEPTLDEDIENLYADVFINRSQRDLQWITLDEKTYQWEENETVVEPGESHQETCEFIVSKHITSVMVYTYFLNPMYSLRSQSAEGWYATTFYDIITEQM